MWRYLSGILMLATASVSAETYHVDSAKGDDANPGTRVAKPWRSLEAVNGRELAPGDEVRFVAGGVWRGRLAPRGSGAPGRPVLLGRYGDGARPRIEGRTRMPSACATSRTSCWRASRSRTAATAIARGGACTSWRTTSAPSPAWWFAISTSTT